MSSAQQHMNLIGMDRDGLRAFVADMGEKPFRADQLFQWIHQHGVADFDSMSNLSKVFRARLAECAIVKPLEVVTEQRAADGTRKWLLRLDDGNAIETVFIPEAERGTLCVSSQAGCALNCSFCSTARQGFNRNLSSSEIIGQLWHAMHTLRQESDEARPVSNVVMMGMGEPLLNFENVVSAMRIMLDDIAYGLSRRRVTLSTAGVVPAIDRLHETLPVSLAVSLHAPDDALRNELVPINKKYPLGTLMAACRRYVADGTRHRITMEYVMLDGINDSASHADALIDLLRDVPSKINLIPFNPFPGAPYRRSSHGAIQRFRDRLLQAGIMTVTRKTRGDDIDAACGQLAGQVQDRTRRSSRLQAGREAV